MLLQPAELIAHLAIFEAFFLFRLVFARLGLDVERALIRRQPRCAVIQDQIVEHQDRFFVFSRGGVDPVRIECRGNDVDLRDRDVGGQIVVYLANGLAGFCAEVPAMTINVADAGQVAQGAQVFINRLQRALGLSGDNAGLGLSLVDEMLLGERVFPLRVILNHESQRQRDNDDQNISCRRFSCRTHR